jgi:hypothetical protein
VNGSISGSADNRHVASIVPTSENVLFIVFAQRLMCAHRRD